MSETTIGIGLHGPIEYVDLASDPNPCALCGQDVRLDPIANFYTLFDCQVVCDQCAVAGVQAPLANAIARVRQAVPLSDFGVEMLSNARRLELANKYGEDWCLCAQCEEDTFSDSGERYYACEKVTRRPICDACLAVVGTAELIAALTALRVADGNEILPDGM